MQNILLITADQLRHDAMGHAGRFPVRTDNLDALATQGTRLTSAYCASPLCGPSRASIMTGQAAYEHGVYYNDGGWPAQTPTLASELSSNGYYSVIVGKTHFQPPGITGGFDKRIGQTPTRTAVRKQKRPDNIPGEVWAHRSGPPEPHVQDYCVVEKADLALHEFDLIHQRREAGPGGHEPFFMWLSFQQPHSPCVPPEPYFSMYSPEDVPQAVCDRAEVDRFPAPVRRWHDGWQSVSPEQKHRFRCQYLGDVTLLDEQIGRVLARLAQLGWDRNTLVVFSSDHGDYLGDHGMLQKGFFHECSVRVPLIFKGPNIPEGRSVDAPVTLAELKPTLLEYAQVIQPHDIDESLRESLTGESLGEARSLMPAFRAQSSELDPARMAMSETGIHGYGLMLRHGDQKYCYYPQTDELEWYDLSRDPDELDNQGHGKTFSNFPDAIAQKMSSVLDATRRHQSKRYRHNGKVRAMFR